MKKLFRKKNIIQDSDAYEQEDENDLFFVKHKINNNEPLVPLKKNNAAKMERSYRPG